MADELDQSLVPPAAGPRVLLVVDDESLTRFGAVPKHIVVGLADAAVRVTILARTVRPPNALELGPCAAIHDPPRRLEFRPCLPEEAAEDAREGKYDMVQCLSVALLERMLRCPELDRVPMSAHITDSADLARWASVGGVRSRLWALPATPTLFKSVLDSKTVRSRCIKLVRLAVIGRAGSTIMPGPDHIPSAIIMTPLTPDCGLVQVLHAMQIVAATHPEGTLFVLGQGPAEHQLRHLAQELGLQQSVVFFGETSQWAEALLGCDIVVMPKAPGRWSSHALEAMAAGRVILAARGGEEDYLVDDQTALLFDPKDVSNLSTCWHRLLTDPETARRLGTAARQFVKTYHSPSIMADALLELYAEARAKVSP